MCLSCVESALSIVYSVKEFDDIVYISCSVLTISDIHCNVEIWMSSFLVEISTFNDGNGSTGSDGTTDSAGSTGITGSTSMSTILTQTDGDVHTKTDTTLCKVELSKADDDVHSQTNTTHCPAELSTAETTDSTESETSNVHTQTDATHCTSQLSTTDDDVHIQTDTTHCAVELTKTKHTSDATPGMVRLIETGNQSTVSAVSVLSEQSMYCQCSQCPVRAVKVLSV